MVVVPSGAAFSCCKRLLEPAVLVGGVVWNKVDHYPQVQLMRTFNKAVKVLKGSKERINIFVVRDVVTGIFLR